MNHLNSKNCWAVSRFLSVVVAALALLLATSARAAAPWVTAAGTGSSTFNLNAGAGYSSQPDGVAIYSWGYGCNSNSATYLPADFNDIGFCPTMQLPGPTLIVHEGTSFTVSLTNSLPTPAGNTSILFPGLTVTATSCGATPNGLLTCEAAPGATVTYTVSAPV